MRVLVTGRPGCGKTTLVKRIAEEYGGCGVYTEEVREGGKRVGFVAVGRGGRAWIARVGGRDVGRYRVIMEGLEKMVEWIEECEGGFIYVDEIGPMELRHPRFAQAVEKAAERSKAFLGTVHRKIAGEWGRRLGAEVVWLERGRWEEGYRRVARLLWGEKGKRVVRK